MKKFYQHYSGLQVSEDGEVWVPKSVNHREHYTYGYKNRKKHLFVGYENKVYRVHILVAEVFKNNNKPINTETYAVHHINGNPSDNRVENLRILTHSEHMALHHKGEKNIWFGKHLSEEHKRKISEGQKGNKNHMYGKLGVAHPNSKPIIGISKTTGEIREFACAREAERELGISFQAICNCCRCKAKSAGGWKWEYKCA